MEWYVRALFPLLGSLNLKDYQGGSNPILVVVLFGLLIFGLLVGFLLLAQRGYKILKFSKICASSKITGEEMGFLKSFTRRLHITEPLDVITHRHHFDEFMNRVGRYYGNLGLSEEDLVQEEKIFATIREKLGLKQNFKTRRLHTSRALPKGYPLNVIVADRETQNIFTFQSKVLHSGEFFLGIAPPERQISKELFNQKKSALEISFDRERGVQYLFDSHLVRTVDFPQTMWYISHSQELIQGEKQDTLNLSSTIMLTNPDEHGRIDEYPVRIHSLTNKGCTFAVEDNRHSFEKTPRVLISFEVQNRSYTCRGQIINLIKKGDMFQYRLNFVNLTPEEEQDLLKFVLHQRDQQKKKGRSGKQQKSASQPQGQQSQPEPEPEPAPTGVSP